MIHRLQVAVFLCSFLCICPGWVFFARATFLPELGRPSHLCFLYFSFLVPPFRCYSCLSSQVSHFYLFHRRVWNYTFSGRLEVQTVLGNYLLSKNPQLSFWKEKTVLSQEQHLLEKEKSRKEFKSIQKPVEIKCNKATGSRFRNIKTELCYDS